MDNAEQRKNDALVSRLMGCAPREHFNLGSLRTAYPNMVVGAAAKSRAFNDRERWSIQRFPAGKNIAIGFRSLPSRRLVFDLLVSPLGDVLNYPMDIADDAEALPYLLYAAGLLGFLGHAAPKKNAVSKWKRKSRLTFIRYVEDCTGLRVELQVRTPTAWTTITVPAEILRRVGFDADHVLRRGIPKKWLARTRAKAKTLRANGS